jgi:hypothetical protein
MARNVYKTPLPTRMREIAILIPDDNNETNSRTHNMTAHPCRDGTLD